jgi:hypothetical protein
MPCGTAESLVMLLAVADSKVVHVAVPSSFWPNSSELDFPDPSSEFVADMFA